MGGRAARTPRSRLAAALLATLAGLALAACDAPLAPSTEPPEPGGAPVTITTADGLALSGRLVEHDRERVAIYLHEYRKDQSTWWPVVAQPLPGNPSVLTFDFRGHGESPGEAHEMLDLTRDVDAAIAFARGRGYTRILVVGAGMGGTVGIVAAADEPDVALLGLSVPTEFAEVRAGNAARAMEGRIALVATRDDLSARDSIERFSEAARIPEARRAVLRGRAHGVDLLHHDRGAVARPFYERAALELLPPPA